MDNRYLVTKKESVDKALAASIKPVGPENEKVRTRILHLHQYKSCASYMLTLILLVRAAAAAADLRVHAVLPDGRGQARAPNPVHCSVRAVWRHRGDGYAYRSVT
jgi:hypothetical protein